MSEDGIITKILSMENHETYATVEVLLGDGVVAKCYVGGQVKVWFDPEYNTIKAVVKWKP